PRSLWEWVERTQRWSQLATALEFINRHDLVELVPRQSTTATPQRHHGRTRSALNGAGLDGDQLPRRRRDIVDREFVPAMRRIIDNPGVVAVVADAGMGKSVLLGQLYDTAITWPGLGVVLLGCAALADRQPRDVDDLDAISGRVACASSSLVDTLVAQ